MIADWKNASRCPAFVPAGLTLPNRERHAEVHSYHDDHRDALSRIDIILRIGDTVSTSELRSSATSSTSIAHRGRGVDLSTITVAPMLSAAL